MLIVIGHEAEPPSNLQELDRLVMAPLLFVPEDRISCLREVGDRNVQMIIATEKTGIEPGNIKSLTATARVSAAMVAGLSNEIPRHLYNLSSTLLSSSNGCIQGPWLFSPSSVPLAISLIENDLLDQADLSAPRFGLTFAVAPKLSHPANR